MALVIVRGFQLKASTFYESNYLAATDVKHRPVEVTIAAVCEGTFKGNGNDEFTKLIIHFSNSAKGLVLSKTNARKIIESLGDETDDWIGATLVLAAGTVSVQGRQIPCVQVAGCRIRPTPKK